MKIPFLDLKAVHEPYREALHEAAQRVIDGGWYVLGDEVAAFEQEFAEYCGVQHAVGVGSGLDALKLILLAYRKMGQMQEGDGILVPANTFVATILAVIDSGLVPLLVEPDAETFNISLEEVRQMLHTGRLPGHDGSFPVERIRGIIPVHLYGRLADMPALTELAAEASLMVIEDAAQAAGASLGDRKAGTFGDAAAFSFYPGKNLGALGDAGAIVTDDGALAEMVRTLGNYGSSRKYVYDQLGMNSRLDEIQAAFLRVKLRHLDEEIAHRRSIAEAYLRSVRHPSLLLPVRGPTGSHVWHQFVIRHPRRDQIQVSLTRSGIGTLIHYPLPAHLSPAYGGLGYGKGSLPLTERLAREVLSLPIGPHMRVGQCDVVVDALAAAVAGGTK